MIEYIVSHNIDDRIVAKSAGVLAGGGIIALPTDTSWSIVCSYKSREGIKRLRSISKAREEQRFTLLCSDLSQLNEVCNLDNSRFRLINRLTPGPYVFILKTLLNTEKALSLRRREIGVRIPDNPAPLSLIRALNHPLYSISAKRDMVGGADFSEEPPEALLFDGGWELEAVNGLDLILDDGVERERVFTTVLDLSGDEIKIIRQGAGVWTP
jgi:tRNA threonylcarbamoyl adenosine modification protein (Sua5/YciO/YrdC/YwlC family)